MGSVEARARDKVWTAKRVRRLWPDSVVTLFVDNLHVSTDARSLENVFARHGRIWDVFIPRKRRAGRMDIFGFVRVGSLLEARMFIQNCDGFTLFGRKMGVKLASFGLEKRSGTVEKLGYKEEKKQGQQKLTPGGSTIKFPSYKEALTGMGYGARKTEKEEVEDVVSVPVAEEAVEWLRCCAVGTLSSIELIPDLMKWVEREKHVAKKIRFMGSEKALIEFHSKDQMEYNIKSHNHQLHRWFDSIKAWSPTDEKRGRRLWLRCMDVPLHVWGERFFRMIGNYWGDTIMVDRRTILREEIEVGRVLIATEEVESIKANFKILVEGESYMIRVAEEVDADWKIDEIGMVQEVDSETGKQNTSGLNNYGEIGGEGTRNGHCPILVESVGAEKVGHIPSLGTQAPIVGESNDGSIDELRSIFENPSLLIDELGSRVEDSLVEGIEEVVLETGSRVEESEQEIVGSEEGEWVRSSRSEQNASRRKRGPTGLWLGNHVIQYRRSRSRMSKRKQSKKKSKKDIQENVDPGGTAEVLRLSDSKIDGANKSVSEEPGEKLNNREKSVAAWNTGKKLGLVFKGCEEKLINRMVELREQEDREYEERKTAA